MKSSEREYIRRKTQGREGESKPTIFRVGDHPVSHAKIERYLKERHTRLHGREGGSGMEGTTSFGDYCLSAYIH
jgi:hypothetical protein